MEPLDIKEQLDMTEPQVQVDIPVPLEQVDILAAQEPLDIKEQLDIQVLPVISVCQELQVQLVLQVQVVFKEM